MNHHLNVNRTGLVFAIFIGGINLLWAILVLLGLAQGLVTFIFQIHSFISPAPQVGAFNLLTALLLVVVAAAVGFLFGAALAFIWNKCHADSLPSPTLPARVNSKGV